LIVSRRRDREFAQRLHSGQAVVAEIWHGDPVRLVANNEVVPTVFVPANDALGFVMLVAIAELAAFVSLRSISHRRLRYVLGYRPHLTSDTIIRGSVGIAIFAVLLAGMLLLAVGAASAGVATVGAGIAVLIYTVVVPQVWPRMFDRATTVLEGFMNPPMRRATPPAEAQ
jgi:hypothetical protein